RGALHPLTQIVREISDIFSRMGFSAIQSPEIETERDNFEALNIPADHRTREAHNAFFIRPPDARAMKALVLRTHTAPMQIRSLQSRGVPVRVISAGRVFRRQEGLTKASMFHRIEGLVVDEGISMVHLKGVLSSVVNAMLGGRAVRFRPHYFPFVVPGIEVDIECIFCGRGGCVVCEQTGWLTVVGAGMVHPVILSDCGVDSERFTGFSFGVGLDRLAMLRWQIADLAMLFKSDARFLSPHS
ncbi:MAG: phenylalanine--tRNA ligase subunit alpha, partial [Myxococcota bacterium]